MEDQSPTLGFLLHDVARLLKRRFEQNARGTGLTRSLAAIPLVLLLRRAETADDHAMVME